MSKLIKNWDELEGLESDEYYLDIDVKSCCGDIIRKSDHVFIAYLSTHTFYGLNYKESTALLQEYGFDVQLKNWDGETEEVNYRDQWLYNGNCKFCRRNNYCSKPCKKYKITASELLHSAFNAKLNKMTDGAYDKLTEILSGK